MARFTAAISLAFGSLFWSTPAHAETLEEAQAALPIAEQAVIDAQATLSAAIQTRDDAEAAYLASAQNGSITETFQGGVKQTNIQVLLNGSTPIANSGNPYLSAGSFTANVTQGVIYINQYPANFEIKPPSPATSVSFYTYARNGDQTITVTFTDNTTATFTNPNGVGNSNCPNYECFVTYTAPEGKSFTSIYFPSDFDIFMIDNVTFQTDTYDPGLYQAYLDAQAAVDAAQVAYDAAVAEVSRLQQLIIDLTPHLNAPSNLVVEMTDTDVVLTWDAPTPHTSNTPVERYAIFWSVDNFETGWAWAHDQTTVTIPLSVLDDTGVLGNAFQFKIRADNDTQAVYSGWSNVVEIQTVAPATPPWWNGEWYEGNTVDIYAAEGLVFGTATAWYGSPNDDQCGIDVSDIVTELILGNPSATFDADNGLFTDPCPGVVKVLRVAITVEPAPEPTPTPSPSPTETTPVVEPTVEPSPEPTQEPTPTPEPAPAPAPEPAYTPTPEPTVEPTPEISETPSPEPTPSPSETSEPVVQETTAPTPTATPTPTVTATPAATATATPTPTPSQTSPQPTPSQTPTKTPEPVPTEEPNTIIITGEPEEVVSELLTIDVEQISDAQIDELRNVVAEAFATAEPGSEEYEQALEALAVLAEADDPELPAELAAIPLLGDVAGAALEVFNNVGNIGADMAPETREKAEKTVIASVIAAQAAIGAVAAATSAATSAASTTRKVN